MQEEHAILSLKFNDDRDLVLKTMMERLEFPESQCIPLDDEIRKIARRSDDVKLIMTIPGVDLPHSSPPSFET